MNQKTVERLEAMLKRSNLINEELTKPEIVNDVKKLTSLAKEQSQLEDTVALYLNYKNVLNNINEAKAILENEKDEELIDLAKDEIKASEIRKEQITAQLKVMLLPKDPNDEKNVIFEIRGAAGGDEGNIFAGDLYRMYLKYAEQQKWKIEVIEENESEAGGFSTISFIVKGDRVYSKMKFESGAHRVQRIPKTESKGRVHTSTATVAVLPEIEEVDFEIKTVDLKIDTYRASGAGGQHVNTTDSAVRITHLPTGVVVTSQDGRSQHDNKALAMQHLRSKLYEEQQRKINEERGTLRKDAVGTGDRSEKIRTYNYPQNRVTDHRINLTLQKLDQIMEGNLDEIITALINEEQRLKMEGN
ncbi:peptide chain release factor 1 [Spiroplasma sp. NBRC 100390]|uniref:peptide chain release factor 1 n=1 Tax=unclassified Spiroplasma TaxID=2637901 RepID=UPI00089292EB|nr:MULTISPECIES: peptide chain release factor 1 [unclassified Spiroplasma]AOX43380.1 peptide chain release factor 1 [Spiroplasma sp. TU-14]APE12850.1 peptide chain release factor 1 [Spiroplasma sp. NBRC 100390]